MIVPEFKLRQNEGFVQVFIRVPYIKVSACQFYIEASTFKFYLKPYLLSLTFQNMLKESQQPAKAVYYSEKYLLEVHLQKANYAETFHNLDLITGLLNNKKSKKPNKLAVEVIGGSQGVVIEQANHQPSQYSYGFSLNYFHVLDHLEEETLQLFEFDPKATVVAQRYKLSNQILIKHFDYDSYLFDKYQNGQQIQSVLADKGFISHIQSIVKKFQSEEINSAEFKMKMSKKQLLVSKRAVENMFNEIGSIVFSYIYELICMCGEFGIESARTINRTSLVLSCNYFYEGFSIQEIMADCFRRCVSYSLYKSLKICETAMKYLSKIMDLKYLIVILMDLKDLFDKNQPRYLLNQLFVDDYIRYLLSLSSPPQLLNLFCEQLLKVKIEEEDLKLSIKQYEEMDEEEVSMNEKQDKQIEQQEKKLVRQLQKMNTLD